MSEFVQPTLPETLEVRRLDPGNSKIYKGEFGLLWCEVEGEGVYRGIFAVRGFPINHPNRYISIRYNDAKDKVREIGVIENLKEFPKETWDLIRNSLDKHYYEQTVTRVYALKWEFGLLMFDVETTTGRTSFMMRWQQDRAQDFGEKGKVLLDVFENRYIIPDVSELPIGDQTRFVRYIYW